MEEIGIDKWCWRMEEHRRKGHPILGEEFDKKTVNQAELFLKGQRVKFWEHNHRIPALNELNF